LLTNFAVSLAMSLPKSFQAILQNIS